MATLPRRLRNVSTPVPGANWTNATSIGDINTCVNLFVGSTNNSHINDALDAGALQASIARNKTTLWLWHDPGTGESVTIMFHAFEGFLFILRSPRYDVCAGVDSTIAPAKAYGLLRAAVIQFAANNSTTTDNLFVYQLTAFPFSSTDLINPVFQLMFTNGDTQDSAAGTSELFSAGGRWHGNQTVWRFIKV